MVASGAGYIDDICEGLFALLEELESRTGETGAGEGGQQVRVPSLYHTRLDSSGRLRLPASVARGLREIGSSDLVLMDLPFQTLTIFDAATYAEFDSQVLENTCWPEGDEDWTLREIYFRVVAQEPDRYNRVLIPRSYQKRHGLADLPGRVRPLLTLAVYGRRLIMVSAGDGVALS